MTNLAELHQRLRPCFARVQPFTQSGKYLAALVSDLPRKNGWTIAEHAGDSTPHRTQRLLNHAVWDTNAAMGIVRGSVAAHLGAASVRVAALDESGQEKTGQEKTGQATAGVQRQYMGCAGPLGRVTHVPAGQPDRLCAAGRVRVPRRTAGRGLLARRCRRDAVSGLAGRLAGLLGGRVEGAASLRLGLDRHEQPPVFLLVRKHLISGELAYHYCWVPPGRPVTLMVLVLVLVRSRVCAGPSRRVSSSEGTTSDSTIPRSGFIPPCCVISC